MMIPYTPSEKKVGETLEQLFVKAGKKRIIVASFSSNIHRVQQIIDVSVRYGRKVAITGRSMTNVVGAAVRLAPRISVTMGLYRLVRNYPDHSVTPYATQVLEHINEEYHLGLVLTDINGKEGDEPEMKKASLYIDNPNTEHFVMIVCNSRLVRVEPLKIRISDFNKKEYRLRTFNIRDVILDDNRTVITIGNFDNQGKAEDYITSMFLNDYIFGGIDKQNYTVKPISGVNYPIFYQSKDLDEYLQFLEPNNN